MLRVYLRDIFARTMPFLDEVLEAHTSWLTNDSLDKPGYHGLDRFNNKQKRVINKMLNSKKYDWDDTIEWYESLEY